MTDAPLLMASFSGEEKGSGGPTLHQRGHSRAREHRLDDQLRHGRSHEDTLAVYGNGTSPVWNDILETCNAEEGAGFELVLSESGVGPSDHTSFYLEDIPVLHFFTGQHEDYHKPTDTADKLNYEGMVRIADFAACIVRSWGSGFHSFYQDKGQFQRRHAPFQGDAGCRSGLPVFGHGHAD